MSVTPRFRGSHLFRQAFLLAFLGGLGLLLASQGLRRHMPLLTAFAPVPVLLWAAIGAREYLRGPRKLDESGVRRRDGKLFPWSEFREKREGRGRLPGGQLGPLNHVDFLFTGGLVRVLPFILENSGEVLSFMEKQLDPKCKLCGPLESYHHGAQKGGREHEDTFLPAEAGNLKDVLETEPGKNRSPKLQRCPACGSYFLYEVSYEYLVSGSEDDQYLSRLSDAEAAKYLHKQP